MKTELLNASFRRSFARALRGHLASAAALLLACSASAITNSLPFYEPFAYTVNAEQLGVSGGLSASNWSFGNTPSASSGRVGTNANLSFFGLTTDSSSGALISEWGTGSNGKNRGAPFTAQSSGKVYMSFLLNIFSNQPPANLHTTNFLGLGTLGSGGSTAGNGATLYLDPSDHLLVSKSATGAVGAPASTPLVLSNTYLIVVSYNFAVVPHEADVWINPLPFGDNSQIPAPTLVTTNGADVSLLQSVGYFQSAYPPGVIIDEIRVATDWASVTPRSCSPGASFNVTGGGAICGAGTGFDVALSGSETGVDYLLMTNEIFDTVLPGTGSALDFGLQTNSAVYTVVASNTVTGCTGWMTGHATVSLLEAPQITVPPVSQSPVSGSIVTMDVQATGDGLTYQWQRNGTNMTDGGEFSGTTNSTLTISPVTQADAAGLVDGYDVVVSGTCSPAQTSTRVSLTLVTAPTLIWSGSSTNVWDIATTADWTLSGNPAVFNSGDNVTFDDTAANPAVFLNNPALNPGTVTFNNSSLIYTLSGGSMNGPGASVRFTGSGVVVMNDANTYGGGTTISSGLVGINSPNAFGSGTLNLGNGMLSVSNAMTLPNAVNVAGNPTILVDNNGTSALLLSGSLSGSSGSLTIANNTPNNPSQNNSPRVTVQYTNFTFNRPIILDNANFSPGGTGQQSTNFYFVLGNSSGELVLNGLISSIGNGQVQRRQAGGNTILSAQNTYTGDTLLHGGGLGFGADSTPTSGGPVTSGPIGTGVLFIDNGSAMSFYAAGGSHTIANPIFWITNTPATLTFAGTNGLTFTGPVDLFGATQTIQVDNTNAPSVFAGVITNGVNTNGNGGGIFKTGVGALTLTGANAYTGPTRVGGGALLVNGANGTSPVTVSNGATLGGTGTISGLVSVLPGGSVSAGNSSTVGTLTLNAGLALQGDVQVKVNESLSPSNDVIVVTGSLNNTGTGSVIINNLGPALAVGDRFVIFNQPVTGGAAMTVTGGDSGDTWTNNLALDGSISLASIGGPKPHPVINSVVASGGNLIFSGTNGTVGGNFYVLSSTNLSLPLSSWTIIATDSFTANGAFSVTNPIVSSTPGSFYLLQVP